MTVSPPGARADLRTEDSRPFSTVSPPFHHQVRVPARALEIHDDISDLSSDEEYEPEEAYIVTPPPFEH